MPDSVNRSVYFTLEPVGGGFTDKLHQFNSFYKLGRSLGFRYLHQPFGSMRSSAGVYGLLGFHAHLLPERRWDRVKQALRLRTSRFIDFTLSDRILRKKGIRSNAEMRAYILSRVEAEWSGIRDPVVRFRYKKGGRRFFRWINADPEVYPDTLDLRSAYFSIGAGRTAPAVFPSGTVKVMVHIRQGDTAILETPWNTFIPLTGPGALKERQEFNPPGSGPGVDVKDYHDFVTAFSDLWYGRPLSFRIFSDGYHRGFARLYSRAHHTDLNERQLAALKVSEQTYDRRKFAIFDGLEDCDYFVGETDPNLAKLIHASMTADIIIVGDQQKMIAKLLANYYNPERPTVVILLFNRDTPPDYDRVGLTDRKAHIFPVRVGDHAELPGLVSAVRDVVAAEKDKRPGGCGPTVVGESGSACAEPS